MKKRVTALIVGLLVLLMAMSSAPLTSHAKVKAAPYYENHLDSKKLTYYVVSSSSYYKGIWKKAIASWNKLNVVKLVPEKSKVCPQFQADMILETYPKLRENWTLPYDLGWGVYGDTIGNMEVKLSKGYFNSHHESKAARIKDATIAIGWGLGLKNEYIDNKDSIMSLSTPVRNTPGPADKLGLQNAYKHVK